MRGVNPNLFWVQQKFVVLLCSVILDIFSLTPQGTRLTQSCGAFCVSLSFHFNKSWNFCPISNRLEGQLRSQRQFVYSKVGIFFLEMSHQVRMFCCGSLGEGEAMVNLSRVWGRVSGQQKIRPGKTHDKQPDFQCCAPKHLAELVVWRLFASAICIERGNGGRIQRGFAQGETKSKLFSLERRHWEGMWQGSVKSGRERKRGQNDWSYFL